MNKKLAIMVRSKKFRILLVIFAPILLATVVAMHEDGKVSDPVYEGKHLSEWLKQLGEVDLTIVSDAGQYSHLPQMDSNAIPLIAEALDIRPNIFSAHYARFYLRYPRLHGWVPKPVSRGMIKVKLIESLGNDPSLSQYTIPLLAKELRPANIDFFKMEAAEALGKLVVDDTNALAALKAAQSDPNTMVSDQAKEALRKIGAKQAILTSAKHE